jgi:hypothetical protein
MHRRARHLNPASAGATLALDSRFISGLNDGDAVTTWLDRTPNGNNATQATAARKPTYKTSVLGGSPIVRFDGGDSLGISNLVSPTGLFTIILFVKKSTSGAETNLISTPGGNNLDEISFYTTSANLLAASTWGTIITQSFSNVTTPHIFTLNYTGSTNFNIGTDGVLFAKTMNVNNPRTARRINIGYLEFSGGVTYLNGDYGIANVFPTALESSLRRRLEHAAAFAFKIPCS